MCWILYYTLWVHRLFNHQALPSRHCCFHNFTNKIWGSRNLSKCLEQHGSLSLMVSAVGFKALYLAQLLACPSALRAFFSQKCPQLGCKMKIITLSITGKAYGVKQERILWTVNYMSAWDCKSLEVHFNIWVKLVP